MKTKPTRSQQEHSTKKKLLLPLFLGGIMILSTFAIIFSGPSETAQPSYTYNDISFRLTSKGWESTLQGQQVTLRYGPQELEPLSSQFPFSSATSLLSLEKMYISTLPNEPFQEAARELYSQATLLPLMSLACLEDVSGCESLPIKTCSDATSSLGVVVFRLKEPELVTVEGTCVTLEAPTATRLTQMSDTLLYALYGIFP